MNDRCSDECDPITIRLGFASSAGQSAQKQSTDHNEELPLLLDVLCSDTDTAQRLRVEMEFIEDLPHERWWYLKGTRLEADFEGRTSRTAAAVPRGSSRVPKFCSYCGYPLPKIRSEKMLTMECILIHSDEGSADKCDVLDGERKQLLEDQVPFEAKPENQYLKNHITVPFCCHCRVSTLAPRTLADHTADRPQSTISRDIQHKENDEVISALTKHLEEILHELDKKEEQNEALASQMKMVAKENEMVIDENEKLRQKFLECKAAEHRMRAEVTGLQRQGAQPVGVEVKHHPMTAPMSTHEHPSSTAGASVSKEPQAHNELRGGGQLNGGGFAIEGHAAMIDARKEWDCLMSMLDPLSKA